MDAKSAIQIGLAVLVLGSFFLMYLSAKTWQWAHAVLVLCVFLASGVFWYLSAAVLKIHASNRTVVNRMERELAEIQAENAAIRQGTEDEALRNRLEQEGVRVNRGSIRQAQHELKKMLLDRGRVWTEAQPQQIAGDGTAQLTIEAPAPHGVPDGTILFAFEQGSPVEGAVYLGEFKVTAVADGSVTVAPAQKLAPRQLQRITGSNASWTLYEVMPIDRHNVFVSMSDDELQQYLPEESVEEYLRHNEPAQPDDPEERVVGYKKDGTMASDEEADKVVERRYTRRLRDYAYIFRELAKQEVIDRDTREQLTRDAKLLQDAIAKAERDLAYRDAEKKKLEYDKQKFEEELQVVQKHLATVQSYLTALEARVKDLSAKNRQVAAELAQEQLRRAREINQRTAPVPAEGATELQSSLR